MGHVHMQLGTCAAASKAHKHGGVLVCRRKIWQPSNGLISRRGSCCGKRPCLKRWVSCHPCLDQCGNRVLKRAQFVLFSPLFCQELRKFRQIAQPWPKPRSQRCEPLDMRAHAPVPLGGHTNLRNLVRLRALAYKHEPISRLKQDWRGSTTTGIRTASWNRTWIG